MLEIYNNNTEIDDAKLIYGVTDKPMTFDGSYESLNKLNLINEIPLKDNLVEDKEDNFVYIPLEVKETFTYLYVFMEYTKEGITRYSNNVKKNEIIPLNSTFYYNVFPITQNVEKYKNSITLWNSSLILDNDLDEMEYTVDLFGEELNTDLFEGIEDVEDSGDLQEDVIRIKNNGFVEFRYILNNVKDDKGILLLHKNRRNLKLVNNGIHESYYFKNKESFNKYLDIYDVFLGEKASFIVITGLEKDKVTKDSKMLLFEVMLDDKYKVISLHKLFPESKNGKEYLDSYKKEGSLISTPLKYIGDHLIVDIDLDVIRELKKWKMGIKTYPERYPKTYKNTMKAYTEDDSLSDVLILSDGEILDYFGNIETFRFYLGNTISQFDFMQLYPYLPFKEHYLEDMIVLSRDYNEDLSSINILKDGNSRLGQLDVRDDINIESQKIASRNLVEKYGLSSNYIYYISDTLFDTLVKDVKGEQGFDDRVDILFKSKLNSSYYRMIELENMGIAGNVYTKYDGRILYSDYREFTGQETIDFSYEFYDVDLYGGNLTHNNVNGTRITKQELEQFIEEFKDKTKDSLYENVFYVGYEE